MKKWSLTLTAKIISGFALVGIFIVLLIWFGFQGINAVNRQLENISNVILPLTQNTDEQKSSILYQNKLNNLSSG